MSDTGDGISAGVFLPCSFLTGYRPAASRNAGRDGTRSWANDCTSQLVIGLSRLR
jgi:hypothetical protein